MKRILLAVVVFAAASSSVYAGDSIEVPWNQVCRQVTSHEVLITTDTGEAVDGYCIGVNVNEVSINVKGKVVKVARDKVARLLMLPQRGQLKALGHGMRSSLNFGFNALLSPAAPAGLLAIPGTLAWGAVSAPFGILGDLRAKLTGNTEIKLK